MTPGAADGARPGPALVVATMPGAAARVGGLGLAERALLAAHEAGFAPLGVIAGPDGDRLRAAAARRGLPLAWIRQATDLAAFGRTGTGAIAVIPGDVLVDARALRGMRGYPREAVAGLVAPAGPRTLAGAGLLADARGWLAAEGLFVPLDAAHPPAVLERRLLDELDRRTAGTDGYLAAILDRPLSRPLTRVLLRTAVTPAQVTVTGIAVGVAGAVGLATTSPGWRLGGALALIGSAVLDCADGALARARHAQSAAGARIDLAGDYVVHAATFGGLAVGLLRQGLPAAGWWAVAALLAGVVAAAGVIHAWSVREAMRRGGDLHWRGEPGSLRGSRPGQVLDRLASRDYTYLLLVLALAGRLEWFVYAGALGSWAFVLAALAAGRRAAAHGPPPGRSPRACHRPGG
jgi:phosphatidylglycerophosphate synthase